MSWLAVCGGPAAFSPIRRIFVDGRVVWPALASVGHWDKTSGLPDRKPDPPKPRPHPAVPGINQTGNAPPVKPPRPE